MERIERKTMLYKTGVEYGDYTMNHTMLFHSAGLISNIRKILLGVNGGVKCKFGFR